MRKEQRKGKTGHSAEDVQYLQTAVYPVLRVYRTKNKKKSVGGITEIVTYLVRVEDLNGLRKLIVKRIGFYMIIHAYNRKTYTSG